MGGGLFFVGRIRVFAALRPGFGLIVLGLCLLAVGCGQSPEDELAGTWYVQAKFGRWLDPAVTESRTFDTDGKLTIKREDPAANEPFDDHQVQWSIVGEWRMRIDPGEQSDAPAHDILYRIEDGKLTLADDAGETILTRDRAPLAERTSAWDAMKAEAEIEAEAQAQQEHDASSGEQ